MRIEIRDAMGQSHMIDSGNPDTLGAWLIEMLVTVRPDEMIPAQIMAWPSFAPGPNGKPDWIADSRILGRIYPFNTPRELFEALRKQVEEAEELRGRDAG